MKVSVNAAWNGGVLRRSMDGMTANVLQTLNAQRATALDLLSPVSDTIYF